MMRPRMFDTTTYALLTTAAATSVLHTLIPDHWLPFVLIGRARGWPVGKGAVVSGASAMIHVALSLLLGGIALGLGIGVGDVIGESLERIAGILLVLFGLAYMAWAWTKGGHFHPGGSLLHGRGTAGSCAGEEGPGHPEHLHYHADGGLISAAPGWGALGLAAIVGLNPCVLVLPIMLAGVREGGAALGLVALSYGIPTILLTVGLTVVGLRVGWRIRLPGVARNAEMLSGGLIAVLGILVWFLEHE